MFDLKKVIPICLTLWITIPNLAHSDGIKKGCDKFSDVSEIALPLRENTLEISNEDNRVEALLSARYTGEPAGAGFWLLVHTFLDESSCFLVYSEMDSTGNDPAGFNNVRLDKAFFRRNGENGLIEIFVPITEYPFASGENYKARIIELNIKKDGSTILVE